MKFRNQGLQLTSSSEWYCEKCIRWKKKLWKLKSWQFFFLVFWEPRKNHLKRTKSVNVHLAKTDDKSIDSDIFGQRPHPGQYWRLQEVIHCLSRASQFAQWRNPSCLEILPHWTTTSSKFLRKEWRRAETQRDLLWFSYLDARMLRVGMRVCTWGRLKRHWTDRTLVEDFTVRTLNVRLQCGHIWVHDIAVHTSVRKQTHGRQHETVRPVWRDCAKLAHVDILKMALLGFLYFFFLTCGVSSIYNRSNYLHIVEKED